ncbi:MAG: hypothetical protein HYY95_06115 [Candidatus Rokubacteria bacterium]|nr:hypothetical protein [Candidatus Rokubacteria bacterium]
MSRETASPVRYIDTTRANYSLPELVGFFGTESRQHMLDADDLSRWYPARAAERREYLARIGKASPFWLGTPAPSA